MLLITAAVLTSVQCSKEEINGDGERPGNEPSEKTVTLTVRSAATTSKTTLAEDGRVMWEAGDIVLINGEQHEVIPDAEDPTLATIPDVPESDGYLAVYSIYTASGTIDGDNCLIHLPQTQYYKKGSFGQYANPMIAYSGTTDLEFKNLMGVIRLGITGSGTIKSATFRSNDGSPLAGSLTIPVQDIRDGNLQNWSEFDDRYESYQSLTIDTEGTLVLDNSVPAYLYFVVPARTYGSGFSVTLTDTEGNIAIQSTENSVTVNRSEIVPMATFAFTPSSGISISHDGSTATSITYTITAEPETPVVKTVISKALWDSYLTYGPDSDEDRIAEEIINNFQGEEWQTETGPDGTFTETAVSAFNSNGYFGGMTAETEYMVFAAYSDGTNSIGKVMHISASTTEAEGAAPGLEVNTVLTGYRDYAQFSVIIKTTDAIDIKCYAMTAERYSEMKASGMEDNAIIAENGASVGEENVVTANSSDGLQWFWTTDISPETDYVIMVAATGAGGMSALKILDYTTPPYLPVDGEWHTISTDGYMECGLFSAFGVDQLEVSDLTIEQFGDYDIFRIADPFRDRGFEESEIFEVTDGYITLDARTGYVAIEDFVNSIGLIYVDSNSSIHLLSMPLFNNQGTFGQYDQSQKVIDFGDVALIIDNYGAYQTLQTRLWFENPNTDEPDPTLPAMSLEGFSIRQESW